MKPPTPHLTRRESQIMEILFRRRRATVEEIRGELPDPPGASSVRKLLDILMARGHVSRAYDGPRFVYFPSEAHADASRSALLSVVRTFFGGSPGATLAALLDATDGTLPEVEYQRLSRILEEARAEGGASGSTEDRDTRRDNPGATSAARAEEI